MSAIQDPTTENEIKVIRLVLTGGPGAGKSTAGDLLRREFGKHVAFVPEAATMLFSGGFPRFDNVASKCAQQHVALEDTICAGYPGRVLLCDRGTVDGAAYWPKGTDDFFNAFNTSLEAELARYDGVLFFDSAACTQNAINGTMLEGGNPHRREEEQEARDLNTKLKQLWSQHPNFREVRSSSSFLTKIETGTRAATEMLSKLAVSVAREKSTHS